MGYSQIIHAVHSACWAIVPEKLEAILDFLSLREAGVVLTSAEIEARIGAGRPSKLTPVRGNIAVLPLYGILAQRMNMLTETSGGTSTDMFATEFDAAVADPSVGAIVIDVDSPGGEVYGIEELSERIYQARGTKSIYAIANSLMASAAYWVASAADQIIVTPGGEVGSIGVVAVHTDTSTADEAGGVKHTLISAGRYKTEGNPLEPLGDEARATIQGRVDDYYAMFVHKVARNRAESPIAVRGPQYGEGRVFGALGALSAGMVDRIATLDIVLSQITRTQAAKARAAARAREQGIRGR